MKTRLGGKQDQMNLPSPADSCDIGLPHSDTHGTSELGSKMGRKFQRPSLENHWQGIALRYRLAYDVLLVNEVLRIFVPAVFGLFRFFPRLISLGATVNGDICFAGALRELSRGNRKQGYDELFGKDQSHWKQYDDHR